MPLSSLLKQIFSKEHDSSNDMLGVYPEKVHVPAFLERRYLKTARTLGMVSIISTCISIMLAAILFVLPSMASSDVVPFAYDPTMRSFVIVEDAVVRKSASDVATENYIREYISLKHTIVPDIDIMTARWQPGSKFYWYSSGPVYNQFFTEDIQRYTEMVRTTGFRRDVYFRWSHQIFRGRWVAEFDTYEYSGWQRSQATRKRWRAYLRIGYDPNKPYQNRDQRLMNPLNFSVLEYNLTSLRVRD